MIDTGMASSDQDGEDGSRKPSGPAFSGLLGRFQRDLRRRLRRERSEGDDPSVADLVLDHPDADRPLDETERSMLLNLLSFRSKRVEDVMVPRVNIIAVEASTSFSDLVDLFRDANHSRLPIYQRTLDDPVGMIHIKDVLACFATPLPKPVSPPCGGPSALPADALPLGQATPSGLLNEGPAEGVDFRTVRAQGDELGEPGYAAPQDIQINWLKLKRPVLFVPPSMPVANLLAQMQAQRVHMALVIDEYGGTEGLVTFEDLMETIFGEIQDEHDTTEKHEFTALPEGGYRADAGMEIEDFVARTGYDLTLDEDEEEVDTLGGIVFTLAGRVPGRHEIIRHPRGYDFEVVEADARRIRILKVTPGKAPADGSAQG